MKTHFCLFQDEALQQPTWGVPILSLLVYGWQGAPAEGLTGVQVTLLECDFEGDEGEGSAAPTAIQEIAQLRVDLVPNTASPPAGSRVKPAFAITNAALVRSTWAPKLSEAARRRQCDFALFLGGGKTIPLRVPREGGDYHREGAHFELGVALEHPAAGRHERVAASAVLKIPSARLRASLTLQTAPTGGLAEALGASAGVLGRFNAPGRNPRVEPTDVLRELDSRTLAALETASLEAPVDVDGLRFDHFVPPAERLAAIERLAGEITIQAGGASDPLPPERFGTGDIQKAYLVIHDIGVKGRVAPDRFTWPEVDTGKGVHGFLNKDGSYAPTGDFAEVRGGTKYVATSMGRWVREFMIEVETVPIVTKTPGGADPGWKARPAGDADACVGWKGRGRKAKRRDYYRWSSVMLDALADLYVLASARACHLLTVTCHVEVDRNLVFSQIYSGYSVAQLRRAATGDGSLKKAIYLPRDSHGDPYGLDVAALYARIRERLNALGGLQLPEGVRFGIDRRRVIDPAQPDADGHPRVIGNNDGHLHTFPWQSVEDPQRPLAKLTGAPAAWKKEDGGPIRKKGEVVDYRPGPWWADGYVKGKKLHSVAAKNYPFESGRP